jgi:hypothetical protein
MNYYVAFTPSCNKDSWTCKTFGTYSTQAEAEAALVNLLREYLEDMGVLDLFKVETYVEEKERYTIDATDEFDYAQQYVFENLDDDDYEQITGHTFVCLGCAYMPSFWVIGSEMRADEVCESLAGLLM